MTVAALLVLTIGCADSPSVSDPTPAAPQAKSAQPPTGLPAFALPGERDSKSDAFDDARAAEPENYAITIPPGRAITPMLEWAPMQALWLNLVDWNIESSNVHQMTLQIIEAALPVADVWLTYETANIRQTYEADFAAFADNADFTGEIRWIQASNDSIWAVDFGPMPILDEAGSQAWVDFSYYHGRPADDALTSRMGRELGATVYRPELAFEGGNIQADADGRCFTTQRGLSASGLAQPTFESRLTDYVGCQSIHYLFDITDDPTGHVDMLFKLVAPKVAVLGRFPEGVGSTKNRDRMEENFAMLAAIDPELTVHRLPMPGYSGGGGPLGANGLPFTYANSTIINGVNLWPRYTNSSWNASMEEASNIWLEALPDYTHIPIVADEIAKAAGAIHCITRTIPTGIIAPWVDAGTCESGACVPPEGGVTVGNQETCRSSLECAGPEWLCGCNQCDAGCPEPSGSTAACGGVSFEGCCENNSLFWCDNEFLQSQPCGLAESCGWKGDTAFYGCGDSPDASPYPEHPRECPCTPKCGDRECGDDGCGGECGPCDGETYCRSDGQCVNNDGECSPQCILDQPATCSDLGRVTCERDSTTGCPVRVARPCPFGQECETGKCVDVTNRVVPQPKGPDVPSCASADSKQAGGSQDIPTGLVILLAAAAMLMRRRRSV
ncbi:MAG: agmatine/peptidylarginine deiminase [Myxococcota bacterium]|jgi:agmatine/peptidylarginine deiminase